VRGGFHSTEAMRVARRPLAPGETDHELLWLGVSLGGLGLAVIWLAIHLPWPVCLFQALTGHPCLTCGATRSAIAFFHLQFLNAWKWNPLAFLAYSGLSLFDAYAFVALVTRWPRLRITNLTVAEKKLARATVVVLLALNWLYLLSHTQNFA
jgi:uncharacterized protein DUF2752